MAEAVQGGQAAAAAPAAAAPAGAPEGGLSTEGMNPEQTAWMQIKSFQDLPQAVNSHMNLEKMLGAPRESLVQLPKDAEDVTGWNEAYSKLGRPGQSSEYDLPAVEVAEGVTDISSQYREWAHEAGLSQRQARGVFDKYQSHLTELAEQQETALNIQSETEWNELKREWGSEFEPNREAGKRAAIAFGLDDDAVSLFEDAIGTKATMKLFARLGRGIGEQVFADASGEARTAQPHGMTPGVAQQEITKLRADKDFNARYYNPDNRIRQAAVEQMQVLYRLANPE